MVSQLFVWAGVLALAGTASLGAAVLLEHAKSRLDYIPATLSCTLYLMGCLATAAAITVSAVRGH